MYVVAIAWLYVVVLMAFAEATVTASLVTFLLWGALPIGMLLIVTRGSKRRRRLRQETLRATQSPGTNEDPPGQ